MSKPPKSINHQVRHLILDYALGAAIVALLPIPQWGLVKAIALLILNLLMLRGIVRCWRAHRGGPWFTTLGIPLGLAGAVLAAFLAWLALVGLGAIVPVVAALAPGLAAFSYFWLFGQTVNHYYLSGVAVPPAPPKATGERHEI